MRDNAGAGIFRVQRSSFSKPSGNHYRADRRVDDRGLGAGQTAVTFVVISGCSGGGKSTLIDELAGRGFSVQPEAGRQIVKEQLSIDGDGVPWRNKAKFAGLCITRAVHFYNTAPTTDAPVFFDRSLIDNIAGYQRVGLPIPSRYAKFLSRYRYADRVFMTPPWRELFAGDAERRHSFDAAVAEFEYLSKKGYPENGYEVVMIPKGTVQARADFLEKQLAL